MKTSWVAVLGSLSIHAFFGYTFWSADGLRRLTSPPDPIQISYIPDVAVPAPAPAPKPVEIPLPKTRPVKAKQIEVPVPARRPARSPAPRHILLPETPPSKPVATPAAPAIPQRPKTANDFMMDPVKGKVFLEYFGALKEKIQLNLRRKYHAADDSLGVVTLMFVLNPDGSLAKAGVVENQSDANPFLRDIALDSLKKAAPFGEFPRDLGRGAVAFSLKVYFDELGG